MLNLHFQSAFVYTQIIYFLFLALGNVCSKLGKCGGQKQNDFSRQSLYVRNLVCNHLLVQTGRKLLFTTREHSGWILQEGSCQSFVSHHLLFSVKVITVIFSELGVILSEEESLELLIGVYCRDQERQKGVYSLEECDGSLSSFYLIGILSHLDKAMV